MGCSPSRLPCLRNAAKPQTEAHDDVGDEASTDGHQRSHILRRRQRKDPTNGGANDNVPLNSFLQRDTSMQRRAMPRQVSRTTSVLSYKSAVSHLEDDGSLDGDLHADQDSSSVERPPGGGSPLSGSSPRGGSPRASPRDHGGQRLSPRTLRKARSSQKGQSRASRGSLGTSISRRTSLTGALSLGEHEEGVSFAHCDAGAFDDASLALTNAVMGTSAASLAEVPVLPVAPWNRQPGYLGHLTEEQERTLEAFRTAFPGYERFHTEHDLLRFLRARSFDLKASRLMYQKYCDVYRQRLLVSPAPPVRDTFGDWPLQRIDALFPHRPPAATEAFQKSFRCFLHTVAFGRDKLGRPVIYMRLCDVVKHNMSQYVPLVDRLALQASACEMNRLLCIMASAKAGYHIEELMQVVDVGKIPIVSMISTMRSTENQAEFRFNSDYVPESLGKVLVINAPFGAGNVWKLAQVFIPPSTREKISICTSDYKSTILQHIDADQVPSCYGGSADFEWPEHEKPKSVYK